MWTDFRTSVILYMSSLLGLYYIYEYRKFCLYIVYNISCNTKEPYGIEMETDT